MDQRQAAAADTRPRSGGWLDIQRLVRILPIRWRIVSIATLNSAAALLLGALIWNGATTLSSAWKEVRQVRESDTLLALLESETSRLQNLIHRYINEPRSDIFSEILRLHEAVLGTLKTRGAADPMLSSSVDAMTALTERFFEGFGNLRGVQTEITRTYEDEILKAAKEMAGLYAIIEASITSRDALIVPSLGKSREAFTATLVAANAYYLSLASDAAEEAHRNIQTIERTIPVMSDLAENDLQRSALAALKTRAISFGNGLTLLSNKFAARTAMLGSIDANQASMISTIDKLSAQMRQREQQAQDRFDQTLTDIYHKVALISVVFLLAIIAGGVIIAHSIREPLRELMASMDAIVSGQYDRPIRDTKAADEVGEMARAVEVFRDNAIARRQAEDDLRASKERAEKALDELREAQKHLIDAEKLAALGGLVAGVAHEVNNPVGISLTVASSLARRCETFAAELGQGPLRRSRLDEFIEGNRDAAHQLVTNLQRAGELIQSFKQVAVDRSHAERRQFDLSHATHQIIASLRPVLKKSKVDLAIDIPEGIFMDSYPGSYGQVLTNLFLNAAVHAFPGDQAGRIKIQAQKAGANDVAIIVADDGIGMTEEVKRRAFDPFFTTRRNLGGTGLGLHIIHNIVTQTLGGRVALESKLGEGTSFRITLPRSAPRATVKTADAASLGQSTWPNPTTSSS
jgi:C4-dicarboxylate-specific signal transduction histidine kinase